MSSIEPQRPQYEIGYTSDREDTRNEFNTRRYATDAYRERTERQGATAYTDRQTRARTDGLRLAVDLYAMDSDATHSVEEVIGLADQLANFILFGTRDSAPDPKS